MDKDLKLLKEIFVYTDIGSKTLNHLLPCIENSAFRKTIITKINENDKINSDVKSEISSLGVKYPKTTFNNVISMLGAKINTAVDKSDSHIAEIIIKNANKGIIDITKKINSYTKATPTCYALARKYLKKEQENIESIKTYL